MVRLALMMVVLCVVIPPTVQRSCENVITRERCFKDCCGRSVLFCIDSCVGLRCSRSFECDSSCCRNGTCTNKCDTDTSNTSEAEWLKYAAPILVVILIVLFFVWKYWWGPKLRRQAATPAAQGNVPRW
ncbi:Hypothetical predicted protein [Paramuricea clavata]|uniref:Uncharacterized protein n=1 Tax=Paramuricea clavata TaxID=317549 RepID=A0A6S7GRW7_PARCT|nr:Hypothetical predicted protein [Paramuricea clavata]